MISYEKYNTEEWQGKKEAAKRVAMTETNDNVVKYIKQCKEFDDILNEDDDSIDSDDPYADRERCGIEDDMYQMNFIERFFDALVHNYVFDGGFFIDNEGICYCPCCRNVSSKWMNHFQIDLPTGSTDNCKKGWFKTPQDLMNHLDNVGENSFIHRSVATYLRFVHKEFFQKKKRTNQCKRTESRNRVLATETPNCELSCYQKEEEISYHVQGREFMKIVDNNWRKRQIEVEGKKKEEERAENKTAETSK